MYGRPYPSSVIVLERLILIHLYHHLCEDICFSLHLNQGRLKPRGEFLMLAIRKEELRGQEALCVALTVDLLPEWDSCSQLLQEEV